MSKTLKEMQANAKVCDCFVYVLDARCPQSCINPEFVKVCKNKPIIFVLNKADLVEKTDIERFKKHFNEFIKSEIDAHEEFIGFMTLHQDLSEEENISTELYSL